MLRRLKHLRPFVHRAIVLTSLLTLVATTVGVPIVRPVLGPGGKDISRPYPCMDSACGCRDAQSCWQGCCCHTNAEKLAWAHAHHVTPPEFVMNAALNEKAKRPVEAVCCSTACCQTSEQLADGQQQATAEKHWQFSLVPALSSRCCHGLPNLWLILSSALPAPRTTDWQPDVPPSEPIRLTASMAASTRDAPPTPPPNA